MILRNRAASQSAVPTRMHYLGICLAASAKAEQTSVKFRSCRCLDLSAGRSKVAVVDEEGGVHAYQLVDSCMGRRLWSGEGAASVACHAQCDGLFAYSGGGQLCTRTTDSLVKTQAMEACASRPSNAI